jgi:hypothetical protein
MPRFLVAIMLVLLLGNTAGAAESADDTGVMTITAQRVKTAPSGLDDPVWGTIPASMVQVAGRLELADIQEFVSTRVIFTQDEIFFLISWDDPTQSTVKQSWHFDGEHWSHLPGDEDRLALLFEIGRIQQFATKSCAVVCHSPADLPREQWKLATKTQAEKGDLWHWKAARSAHYGYADDGWLTVAGNPSGSYRETGRRNDAGEGGDVHNEEPGGMLPRYMFKNPPPAGEHGILLFEEAVPIDPSFAFKAGDVIPYRLPVLPKGSRFDVKAESRHADGRWTVMLRRALQTGNADDVAFDTRKRYSFAMAVFDDSGADHSKATRSLALQFRH